MNFDILKTNQFYNILKIKEEIIEIFQTYSKKSLSLSGTTQNHDLENFTTGPLKNTNIYEKDFKFLHSSLSGTEIEKIWIRNQKNIGRFRILVLKPSESYEIHIDADYRHHLAIFTNESSFLEIEDRSYHIPENGYAYLCNTRKLHRAINNGETDRVHLVWNDRHCE